MKKLILSTILIMGAFTETLKAQNLAQKYVCHNIFALEMDSREKIVAFQSWLAYHFKEYPSRTSVHFTQATAVSGDLDNKGTEVISFGSGPDVFTPLINYPLARNFHLVDLMSGWGRGAGNVLAEIVLRLKAVHPNSLVTLEDQGFLKNTPRFFQKFMKKVVQTDVTLDDLKDTASFEFDLSNHPYKDPSWLYTTRSSQPIILRVEWPAEHFAVQTRRIFVHFMNFDARSDLAYLSRFLKGKDLAGIIVQGIHFSRYIEFYLKKLPQNATAFLETYSDQKFEFEVLDRLRQSGNYEIKQIHRETFLRYNSIDPIEQNLNFVKKVH